MVHKDIRIQFEIEDRRYEAVGFLNEDEPSIEGYKIFPRVNGDNGGVIDYREMVFINEHRNQLPTSLNEFVLVTDSRDLVDDLHDTELFRWMNGKWWRLYGCVDQKWGANYLVLRRLP